jgi:hypothetical protein
MSIDPEQLRSGGKLPSGPVSAWPRERNEELHQEAVLTEAVTTYADPRFTPKGVDVPAGKMARGLLKTVGQALTNGKVSSEIREERYDTCKSCPFFDAESKRCKDCGCFMEAKTWVGGNPQHLCPQKKWSR